MHGTPHRPKRVGEQIRHELASMCSRELKDPRLQNTVVTICDVKVTRDLSFADVYVSVLDEAQQQAVMDAFDSARGFIRRELAHRIRIWHMPELRFHLDTTIADGMRLYQLIEQINQSNGENESH